MYYSMINYSHHAAYYVHVTSFCNWNFMTFDPLNPFCPPHHPDLWQPPIYSLSLSYILSYSYCVLCILHVIFVAKISFKKKKKALKLLPSHFFIYISWTTLYLHIFLIYTYFHGVLREYDIMRVNLFSQIHGLSVKSC